MNRQLRFILIANLPSFKLVIVIFFRICLNLNQVQQLQAKFLRQPSIESFLVVVTMSVRAS